LRRRHGGHAHASRDGACPGGAERALAAPPLAHDMHSFGSVKIDGDRLVGDVMWRAAIPDPRAAATAVEATLEALGERLSAHDAAAFAECLPPSFAAALVRLARHTAPKPAALYARLAVTEGVSAGQAVEHAETVCHALGEALGPEERLFLQRRLPPEWAALFVPRPRATESPSPPGPVPGHGHTLATGKLGRGTT
jgi:uncharacterized protein (DUF2267 family)